MDATASGAVSQDEILAKLRQARCEALERKREGGTEPSDSLPPRAEHPVHVPAISLPEVPDPDPLGPIEVVIAEPPGRRRRPRHRPPDELPKATVLKCEKELKKRASAGRPKSGNLTLKAIALRVDLPRTRVTQIEQLMESGWPLLRTHPDFPARPGFVRLPSLREAALLLRSG